MNLLATNDRARFDYEIIESFQAGLVLVGQEVKSIRLGKVQIKGSFVNVIHNELSLIGAIISPYQPNNVSREYDPQRTRKLLVKKSELKFLIGKSIEDGLTLVPLKIYDKGGLIKIEIGIGRGKKKYDKRETIKRRELDRYLGSKIKSKN